MAVQLCHVTLPNGVTELLGVSASEASGVNGKITFTPVLNDVVGTGGGLAVPDQVETFVKDGQWVDKAGNPGAWFVRPDSTDATFVYSAKVDLGYRTGGGNAVSAFHIAVPAAGAAVLDEIRALPGPPHTWITKGETGPAPEITNGTIATGAPGSPASLTFTATGPGAYVANGSVPQGQTGAPGGSDPAFAAFVADTGSETRGEVDAAIDANPTVASVFTKVTIPDPAEQIVYVTTRGNDANDGLTWRTAKTTIAAGLAALGSNPGVIQLGPGNLTTAATHTLGRGVTVRGISRELQGSSITYTGTGALFTGTSGTRTYSSRIENVYLSGPGKTSTAVGVDLVDVSMFSMSGVTMTAWGVAIKHRSAIAGGAVYNHFRDAVINNCGTGVQFGNSGSNGSRWYGVKFGGCDIAADVTDSNENNFHACQFEVNTTGIYINSTAAGSADNNSIINCRFESNTTAWNIASANVRDTLVIGPAAFGTYTVIDNGTRTTTLGGSQAWATKSAVGIANGSWRFDRYINAPAGTYAMVVRDSATGSGNPVTLRVETERSTGSFIQGSRGGVVYFEARADGVLRSGAGVTGSRPAIAGVPAGGMYFDTTLGKPVWSNGTAWILADGTVV